MTAQGLYMDGEPLTPCDGCGEYFTDDMLKEKWRNLPENRCEPVGVYCEDCYGDAK
jgi:hypothetical protein